MNLSISHPTDRPNFTVVYLGRLTVWFSYQTAVGFQLDWLDPVVRQNGWGPTTGKHLNYIDGGSSEAKTRRVYGETFDEQFMEVMRNAF